VAPLWSLRSTPTISPRLGMEDSIENIASESTGPMVREARLKRECLARDGYICVVTGCLDAKFADVSSASRTAGTECVYIIPFSLASWRSGSEEYAKDIIWINLVRHFPTIQSINFNRENINDTKNAMTMADFLHKPFGCFDFSFEATSQPHRYRIQNYRPRQAVLDLLPATVDITSDKIPIPVPSVFRWVETKESPSDLGPFIIMDYIHHKGSMVDLLETPGLQGRQRPVLNPALKPARLEALYGKLANIVLSLSTLSLNRIGSLTKHDEDSTWEVLHRPLSYSMNEIVQLGTLPRSKLPTSTYDNASSYFEALADLHISHLGSQRNEADVEEDVEADVLADDIRRKFVARFLFRKLVRDQELRKQWIFHDNGPFPVWCDDFRPENVLVDEAESITGVVDWEFTYTAPAEFSHAPPWWLLLKKPEDWSKGLDDWCTEYEKPLQTFLEAMRKCEDEAIQERRLVEGQRLSSRMRDSWQSGDFWIMYAARNNFAFDAIY
jgi:hypothetical protein